MPETFSVVCSPASDPVLVPSNDTRVCAAVGAVKREAGSQCSPVEPKSKISLEHKANASKMGGKSQGAAKNHAIEFLQPSSLSHGSSSLSRPSSNYGSRSQQAMGSQKDFSSNLPFVSVGPNKEWKPKPIIADAVHVPKTQAASADSITLAETSEHTHSVESATDSEEATDKLQKGLESLQVRDAQHVIIPNHIHVPDALRPGLSFGSFDASFVIAPNCSMNPEIRTRNPFLRHGMGRKTQ